MIFYLSILFFTAHRSLGFYYIIYTVLQSDLLPLRPHCGKARTENRTQDGRSSGRDTNHGTTTPPFFIKFNTADFLSIISQIKYKFLHIFLLCTLGLVYTRLHYTKTKNPPHFLHLACEGVGREVHYSSLTSPKKKKCYTKIVNQFAVYYLRR